MQAAEPTSIQTLTPASRARVLSAKLCPDGKYRTRQGHLLVLKAEIDAARGLRFRETQAEKKRKGTWWWATKQAHKRRARMYQKQLRRRKHAHNRRDPAWYLRRLETLPVSHAIGTKRAAEKLAVLDLAGLVSWLASRLEARVSRDEVSAVIAILGEAAGHHARFWQRRIANSPWAPLSAPNPILMPPVPPKPKRSVPHPSVLQSRIDSGTPVRQPSFDEAPPRTSGS